MPALLFYRNNRKVLRFPIAAHPETKTIGIVLKIGRHPSNDITLPDEEISRSHAVFELREDGYWIVDQSRNGTFVNGRRIQETPLKNQDEIQMGVWRVVFADDEAWGEKETVVRKKTKTLPSFSGLIGQSEPMKHVFSMIERAAPTEATILIVGETGTGKELVARAIHERSPRERNVFIALNCGAISPQLIESELFGHERGAFTGALSRHLGAFEQARGGTIFLDEVGELPLELQPKLLRVLEERRFRRVGGVEEILADVRVVAATHRNLESLSREGKFREDLYFRLFSVPILLPPLRERSADIPLLVDYFMESLPSGDVRKTINSEAMGHLIDYPWRGNVRELKNVMTRSLLFSQGEELGPKDMLFLSENTPQVRPSLKSIEKEAILSALRENNWNKKDTSETLGIAKSTLFHKLKEYEIKDHEK